MKPLLILISILVLTSCIDTKKKVRYSELSAAPELRWQDKDLIIAIKNPLKNSEESVYDIETRIERESNSIILDGLKGSMKEYKSEFRLLFGDIAVADHGKYKIFWTDPDGNRMELVVSGPE